MRIVVSSCLTLHGFGLESRSLRGRWQVPNPAYVAAERMGRYCRHLDPTISAASGPDVALVLQRGLLDEVLGLYPGAEVVDQRQGLDAKGAPDALNGIWLRAYQLAAIADTSAHADGILVGPCGSGKTVMGLEVIRRVGVPALVLVHTKPLLSQWQGAIKALLGEWGVANVTVCTVQSLWGTKARAEKPLPPHGLLMVDEAHLAPASCFKKCVARSTARYRYGLTATPDREDGMGPVMQWTFGPIRHTVPREEIKAAGQSVTPRYELIKTGCDPDVPTKWNRAKLEDELDFTALVTVLSEDTRRTKMIADLATHEADHGHAVLVLTTRVANAEAIAIWCANNWSTAHVVTGTMGAKAREAALDDVRAGRVRIIIATQLADLGLDLPVLDRLLLALPSKAQGRTIQRVGRIMRPVDGKGQPIVYDFVDNVGVCWAQQRSRKRAFDIACGVA